MTEKTCLLNNKHKGLMLILALLPIFNIYQSPLIFTWGEWLMIGYMLWSLLNSGKKKCFHWEQSYLIYWVYVAVVFIYCSFVSGRPYKAIVPGGVSFCLFSLMLGFCDGKLDLNALYKYFRIVSVFAIGVFILQELSAITLGYRFSALIPFGTLTDGTEMKVLIATQMGADRSCSIFREPAHFAQYLWVVVLLELFYKNKAKLITPFQAMLILTLLFLRSGNGLLALAILFVIKYLYHIRRHLTFKHIILMGVLTLAGIVGLSYFASTAAGEEIVGRTVEFENDESTKSYIRIYRGYDFYAGLPTSVKLFGTDVDGILELVKKSGVSYLFTGEEQDATYFNGVQSVLIRTGAFGMVFLLIFIVPVFKKDSVLGRAALLCYLAIALVGQNYLNHAMLMAFLIALYDMRQNKQQISRNKITENCNI